MSTPKLLIGILTLLVMANVGLAGRFRCGHWAGRHRAFGMTKRTGCVHPSLPSTNKYIVLAWKLKRDKTFYQEMTTETSQQITVMGQSVSYHQKMMFFFSFTPIEKDQTGNWKVKQKIDGLKMESDIAGNKITFDSTKKGAGGPNPLSDYFKALIGSEFLLTIDKEMKVSKLEGRDEFLKKLLKENSSTERLLKTILSDDALKQMSDTTFALIPNKAVRIGDSWEWKTTVEMGSIGSFRTTYKCTYEGPEENNLEMIKVDPSLEYILSKLTNEGELPFKILKADLASKNSTGVIRFDSRKGQIVESRMTMTLGGTMNLETGGMPSEVTIVQTQTTTAKTSDENPISK
jgi:Family of unknown function (DUF6263)